MTTELTQAVSKQPPIATDTLRHIANTAWGCMHVFQDKLDPAAPVMVDGVAPAIPALTMYQMCQELLAYRRREALIEWFTAKHLEWVQSVQYQDGEYFVETFDPDGTGYRIGTSEHFTECLEKIALFLENPLSHFRLYQGQ